MDNINKYLAQYKITHYQKNDILFYENTICNVVGFIINGSVKISTYLENGSEVIYNIIKNGGMFGSNLIFASNNLFRGDVVATDDVDVYLLSKDEIISLLMTNKNFMLDYLRKEADFSKELNSSIKLLTFNNAIDRVLYYLDLHNGKVTYKSITELAAKMFLTRESLSRTLHKLSTQKILVIKNKEIVKL